MVAFDVALKNYLVTLGHGPFSVGNLKDSPRDLIAIYDTGGEPTEIDDQVASSPEVIDIQIRARNRTQAGARTALLAIQDDLHRLTGVDIGDWVIQVSVATDRPAVLTREAKGAWSLVSNYTIRVRAN
jgi:hypothetical protein